MVIPYPSEVLFAFFRPIDPLLASVFPSYTYDESANKNLIALVVKGSIYMFR